MKIIMTGGGTAGHITPNIALFPRLRQMGFEIHYVGTKAGMEAQLIEKEGIPYHAISAGKLRRYLDIKNLTDMLKIGKGFLQALAIIRKVKPDVVFSKGGFVSCPVVWAAWANRIPVVIHESDYTPGLANKLSIPFARKICYTFPETAKYIDKEKGVLTGIPVRDALFAGNAEAGRKLCGFAAQKPVLLVMGGSQGSGVLNQNIRQSLQELLKSFQICHICGKGGVDESLARTAGYKQFEYVTEELPHLFAMTDLMVARAGATSLFEFLVLKKPSLLIPLSRQASRGDQILNARSFQKQGYSHVLMEEDLTPQSLLEGVAYVQNNRDAFRRAMSQSRLVNGIAGVAGVVMEVVKR